MGARWFSDYHDAYDAALALARECKCAAYIQAQKEYGKPGFAIGLFCVNDSHDVEIVRPSDPVIARKES